MLVIPVGHLNRVKLKQDVERVVEMAEEREIEGFVVGLPYTLAGEVGVGAGVQRGVGRRHPVSTVVERAMCLSCVLGSLLQVIRKKPKK